MTLAFRAEKDQLRQAVEMVAKLAAQRFNIAATAGVRLEVEGDKLHLAATDLETSITTTISVAGLSDGVAVIPAKRLSGAVANLPDGAVTVTDEEGRVTLKAGKSRFTLPTYAAEEFPRIEAPVGGTAIDGAAFRAALSACIPAANTKPDRPILTGVYLHADPTDDRLTVVCTDSHRLHKVVLDEAWEAEGAIIPATALAHLVKLSDAEVVVVARQESTVTFSAGDTVLTTTLIAGEYPNYPQLISTPAERMVVEPVALAEEVRRVDFAVSQVGAITFAISSDRLALSGRAEDGTTSEGEVEVTWSGPDLTLGLNPRFFLDALATITTPTVEIRLTDDMKPLYLRPIPDDGTTVAIMMPIRLGAR